MTELRPRYVVGVPGPSRDEVASILGPSGIATFDGVEAFAAEPGRQPGIVFLVVEGLTAADVLGALDRTGRGRGEWTLALVRREGAEWVARTLGLGYPHGLAALREGSNVEEGTLMELRAVLSEISRARHDINNPLTSALAETQLLMMDAMPDAATEALQTILEQLRRIRDLVAATRHLRPLE